MSPQGQKGRKKEVPIKKPRGRKKVEEGKKAGTEESTVEALMKMKKKCGILPYRIAN